MQGVAVHWEGVSSEPDSHAGCGAQWEGIRAYHARVGYGPNTAYNWGVCFHGQRFTGRGWDTRSAANGAGVPYNATHYAVCWFGGVNTSPPSEAAKAGIRGVLDEAAAREGATDWIAHSDCVPTQCPGDVLRDWVHVGAPVTTLEDDMTPEQDNVLNIIGARTAELVEQVAALTASLAVIDNTVNVIGARTDTIEQKVDGLEVGAGGGPFNFSGTATPA